jgi:predicted Zn-dependent protease
MTLFRLLIILSKLALELPRSRREELEADTLGMELAARAGFDVAVAVDLERKIARAIARRLGYH